MADIELVIRLSEKNCEYIKRFGASWIESEKGSSIVSKAILDGILLPKGHGRLFDERDIVSSNYEIIGNRIYELEPIIEADKVGSEDEE